MKALPRGLLFGNNLDAVRLKVLIDAGFVNYENVSIESRQTIIACMTSKWLPAPTDLMPMIADFIPTKKYDVGPLH